MTLLSGIRNLIGRKRESSTGYAAATEIGETAGETRADELTGSEEASITESGSGAAVEIEAKSSGPEFVDGGGDEVPAETDVAQRLEEIDNRLGASGAETRRLVKELSGLMESNSADIQRLVQKLDERIARLLELVGEQGRSEDRDEAITAAVDAAAQRFIALVGRNGEAHQRMQAQLDAMGEAVTRSGEQTDKLAYTLDDIRERTTGLDEAIARIGQSIVQREGTSLEFLHGTRRSMMLFAYGCTFASLLALGIAVAAIILA